MARNVQTEIDELLRTVIERAGSDIVFAPGAPISARFDGELIRLSDEVLSADDSERLARELVGPQWDRLVALRQLDFSFTFGDVARVRANLFFQRGTLAGALRLIPYVIPSLDELGTPAVCAELTTARSGLVLVTGATGSGKSSTLAAMIDRINRTRACHILTIEQPIEFLHKHQTALVNQREVGEDTDSFASGLRYAFWQDPDVLVVGELPDVETVRLALAAAETGQLVLATLRTMDVPKTIERIIEIFPVDQQAQVRVQLANNLRGIVVQQLVPALDGGVALASEVLLPTPEVIKCIRTGDSASLVKAILGGMASGMGTMDQSLAELVQAGLVDVEDAADLAVDPNELRYLTSGPS